MPPLTTDHIASELLEETLLTLEPLTTGVTVLAINATRNPEQTPRVRRLLGDLVALIQEAELGTFRAGEWTWGSVQLLRRDRDGPHGSAAINHSRFHPYSPFLGLVDQVRLQQGGSGGFTVSCYSSLITRLAARFRASWAIWLPRPSTLLCTYGFPVMDVLPSRVFMNGNSQAVRIPAEFRLSTDRVQISRNREGDLVIHPCPAQRGQALLDVLEGFDADFVIALERQQADQLPLQEREAL